MPTMMALGGAPTSRLARTKVRQKVRARKAREDRLRASVETWLGAPLRSKIADLEHTVVDLSEQLQIRLSDSEAQHKKLRDHVQPLEGQVDNALKEVANAVFSFRNSSDQARFRTIERNIAESNMEVKELREKMVQDAEAQDSQFEDFATKTAQRLADAEVSITHFRHTRAALDDITTRFNDYLAIESERETFMRRYEYLVKDMEARMWPWRPGMDRSESPPPKEDRESYRNEPFDTRSPWMVWPAGRSLKATPSTSIGSYSARPTPPTSRPSSARYGRPTSASSVGSGFAAARGRSSLGASAPTAVKTAEPRSDLPAA